MNVLLIGGSGSLINNMIIKFNKEGHRVYLLTGSRYGKLPYQKVFERYNFTYDCSCLNEIFISVNPDITIFVGAYDTNFTWAEEEAAAVRYSLVSYKGISDAAVSGYKVYSRSNEDWHLAQSVKRSRGECTQSERGKGWWLRSDRSSVFSCNGLF